MDNQYTSLKNKQQKEINNFPCFFAFNEKQFIEGMKKLNIIDKKDLTSLPSGMIIKKTELSNLLNLFNNQNKEFSEAIENDKTGNGFIYDMFNYELCNHEYCYTEDITNTINALNITIDQINDNPALLSGLNKAISNNLEQW